jgi:hypothetical protein
MVQLYEQTDFLLFLDALSAGLVRYDPALKIEAASTSQPRTKKRNQFRSSLGHLRGLYERGSMVNILADEEREI